MFSLHLPNSWVQGNSSRMPQVSSYKDNPMASIQIYHIYAVDLGLYQIKFIINPVHSYVLWIVKRNNFLDV